MDSMRSNIGVLTIWLKDDSARTEVLMWCISISQSAIAWAACLLMVGAAPTWVIAEQPPIIGTFDPSFTAFVLPSMQASSNKLPPFHYLLGVASHTSAIQRSECSRARPTASVQ